MSTEIFNAISIILTLVIGFGTIWFAKSQSDSARKQVELANSTNSETKKLLEEINIKVNRVELISEQTKQYIEKQIDKLIDNQNAHQTALMTNLTTVLSNFDPKIKQNDAIGTAMMNSFLNGSIDIDKLTKLAELGNQMNKPK